MNRLRGSQLESLQNPTIRAADAATLRESAGVYQWAPNAFLYLQLWPAGGTTNSWRSTKPAKCGLYPSQNKTVSLQVPARRSRRRSNRKFVSAGRVVGEHAQAPAIVLFQSKSTARDDPASADAMASRETAGPFKVPGRSFFRVCDGICGNVDPAK